MVVKNPMMRHYATFTLIALDVEKVAIQSWRIHDSPVSTTSEPVWKEQRFGPQVTERLSLVEMQNIIALSLLLFGQWLSLQANPQYGGNLLKIGNDRMPIEQIDLF